MKILSTIAALACSVTLVNAQQSPRRPAAPAPTPRPRVQIVEPMIAPPAAPMALPGIDAELPSMSLFTPGQTPLAPLPAMEALEAMTMAFPLAPRPGEAPMALEFPMFRPGQGGLTPPRPSEPLPPLETFELMAPITPMAPFAPMVPLAPETPLAPLPSDAPMFFDLLPGQGPGQGPVTPRPARQDREFEVELRRLTSEIDRAERERQRALSAQDREAAREAESLLRTLQREIDQGQREQAAQERALARELASQDREMSLAQDRVAQQAIRELEMQNRVIARETAQQVREAHIVAQQSVSQAVEALHASPVPHYDYNSRLTVPPSWAPQDVADSIWRNARELINRGEYGQAVQAFRSIPTRYPNSAYAPEAAYYQAFALFRIGGTSELREALAALDASKTKYPNARSKAEAASLATRIRGVLAQRGDAQAAAELRAAASEQGVTCDREEQAVQQEAMNQLSRMEGSNINELITRVLARKDECAIPLRRTAIFLVGNRRDAQAVTILSGVARNDPSVDVRVEAINVISRMANEEGVPVLEELVRSDDERIQRAAIRSLVRHPSARARASVRGLVERDDVSERVRSDALSAFDSDRATADDVAWLRALYAKVTTPSLKSRTLSAIVRVGGTEVDQWLVTLARDDNQPSEIRATAMRRIGETMSIPDLGRLYDSATQQRFRSEIINVLGKRKEDAATDKLIDIVKNGTDPALRRSALNAVVSKKDARTQQLLLEIINK